MGRSSMRWASTFGDIAIVFGLSKIHARWIADPPYDFTGSSRFGWALAYVTVLAFTSYAAGLPEQPRSSTSALGVAARAAVVGGVAISITQLVVGDALLPRFVVLSTMLLTTPWQVAVNGMVRRSQRAESRDRVLLIASRADHAQLATDLRMDPTSGAAVVACVDPSDIGAGKRAGHLAHTCRSARATLVVVGRSAMADDDVVAEVAALHESGIRVRTLVGFYEEWLAKLPASELERTSLLFDIGEVHSISYLRTKRALDVALGTLGAVAVVLVAPLVGLANLCANRGPLLYRQVRIGKGGRPFTIYKFRSMRAEAGSAGPDVWTAPDDPRITPFGRLLRRTHLDELPQAVNVLRGDLSVVGPRPEQPHYVEELSAKLPFYQLRHLVRPGMTGWAQVMYGYAGDESDALEKLQYEFFYLRHQHLTFDLRILLRTLRSIVGGQGAGR